MNCKFKWSSAYTWTCAVAVAGIAAAYTPALGNGSTWSLPYSGTASSTSEAFLVTNSGSGIGIYGQSNGTNSYGTGVEGYSAGSYGTGVYGYSYGEGVLGYCISASGQGVYGYGGAVAVYGNNPNSGAIGIQGIAAGNGTGVYGSSYTGVYGVSDVANGVGVGGRATTSTGFGLAGTGTNGADGLYAQSDSGYAVEGESSSSIGVFGVGAIGVYGEGNGSGANLAGEFMGSVVIAGNLQVNGTINKSAVGFKIDHPLDPAHKFLMHSCVESNEMMNIYRGNAILDSDGKALVSMPNWFQAENRDISYQLTAIGAPAPGLYVAKEIENNAFEVAGGAPGMKISWQVTGARNDKYAATHPLYIEVDKAQSEQGKYIRPEEYGQPQTKMIGYVNAPHHSTAGHRTGHEPTVPTPPRVLSFPTTVAGSSVPKTTALH